MGEVMGESKLDTLIKKLENVVCTEDRVHTVRLSKIRSDKIVSNLHSCSVGSLHFPFKIC